MASLPPYNYTMKQIILELDNLQCLFIMWPKILNICYIPVFAFENIFWIIELKYPCYFWLGEKKQKAYGTECSQVVTLPSTDSARCCLTSVIGREPVCSTWYGRKLKSTLPVNLIKLQVLNSTFICKKIFYLLLIFKVWRVLFLFLPYSKQKFALVKCFNYFY